MRYLNYILGALIVVLLYWNYQISYSKQQLRDQLRYEKDTLVLSYNNSLKLLEGESRAKDLKLTHISDSLRSKLKQADIKVRELETTVRTNVVIRDTIYSDKIQLEEGIVGIKTDWFNAELDLENNAPFIYDLNVGRVGVDVIRKQRWFKPPLYSTRLTFENPNVFVSESEIYTRYRSRPFLTVGPFIGVGVNGQVSAGLAVSVPIFTFYYKN